MPQRPLPTEQEVKSYIRDRRNWGRWGKDDQRGTLNLITAEKRKQALRLARETRPALFDHGILMALLCAHLVRDAGGNTLERLRSAPSRSPSPPSRAA